MPPLETKVSAFVPPDFNDAKVKEEIERRAEILQKQIEKIRQASQVTQADLHKTFTI